MTFARYSNRITPVWLNSTSQNALRAVLYIAEQGDVGLVPVDDIATSLGIPRNYLSKTMHALTRAGVLRSVRGRNGGFQLVDAPEDLVLSRIVAPFQPALERRCLMGRAVCGDANPCQVHDRWSRVANDVQAFFNQTTVAQTLKKDPAVPKS